MCSESHRACFCSWCSACSRSADTRQRLHKICHHLRADTHHDTSSSSFHLCYSTFDHKAQYFRTHSRPHNLFRSNFRGMTRSNCSYRCNSVHRTRSGTQSYKGNCGFLACLYILGNTRHCLANIRLHQYNLWHQLKVRSQENTSSCNYLQNCCTLVGSHVDWVYTRLYQHRKFGLVEAESQLNTNSWTFQACSRTVAGNPIGQFGIHQCLRMSCHHFSAENRAHTSIWNLLERLNKRIRNLLHLLNIRWHLDSVSRRVRECNPKNNHSHNYQACSHTHAHRGSETGTRRCQRTWFPELTNPDYTYSNNFQHYSHTHGHIRLCWWCIRRGRCMISCRFWVYTRSNKNTESHHPCSHTCVDSRASPVYIHQCHRKIDCCGWTCNRWRRYIGDTGNHFLCRYKIDCSYR